MDPASIIAIIGLVITAATTAAQMAPTSRDAWRRNRLKQLSTLVTEGLTPAEEEELRTIGMEGVRNQQKQIAAQRADELASLTGGATANDIRAFEASDNERVAQARQVIDTEIMKQDIGARKAAQKEQGDLTAEKSKRVTDNIRAAESFAVGAADTIAGLYAGNETATSEGVEGTKGIKTSANRVYGEQGGEISLPTPQSAQSKAQTLISGLTPDERAELIALLKGG